MDEQEWIQTLETEGFKQVAVCVSVPRTDFPQHTHEHKTVHVILKGSITLEDEKGPLVLKKGERFEIPAGTIHRAYCGEEGCTFVVGTKEN